MGIRKEKILVLANGVDEDALAAPTDGTAVRQHCQCENTVVVGFAGWFVPWHRLDILVAQFAALTTERADLRLMLVGDGPMREGIEAQAAALGIRDRLILPGPVPHAEMPKYLAAMDICTIPHSNAYRSPIKLFEYMAGGRPVVAPSTEPIALVLRHAENGLLFTPEDGDDLRTQLATLVHDPELRARIGKQASADVRQKHTWTQNARELLHRLA
jgi:glycosyltransferase involved in cell wall biosynthesis